MFFYPKKRTETKKQATPKKKKKKKRGGGGVGFAGDITNNIHMFYWCIINDNTLSWIVPILELQNLFEINLKDSDCTKQNLKQILPSKSWFVYLL